MSKRPFELPITIVDVSQGMHRAAREKGAHANMMDARDVASSSSVPERWWKQNLLREYYRQTAIAKERAKILRPEDTMRYAGLEENREASMRAQEALFTRFAQEEAFYIHREAGERKKVLGNSSGESAFKANLERLIRRFVAEEWDDAQFVLEKEKIFASLSGIGRDVLDSGEMYADNLLRLAKEVRQVVVAGERLEDIDFQTEVILGRARTGARTETEYGRIDRVVEKLGRSPLKPFQKPLAQALGLASSALTFVGMGESEHERVVMERRQHARDRAAGFAGDPRDARREALEKTLYEAVPARKLIEDLYGEMSFLGAEPALREQTRTGFERFTQACARLRARVNISDRLQVDLVRYEAGAVEEGRLEIDAAYARALQVFERISPEEIQDWTGEPFWTTYLTAEVLREETRFTSVDRPDVQASIDRLKGAKFLGVRTPLAAPLTEEEAERTRTALAASAPVRRLARSTPPLPLVRPVPAPPVAPRSPEPPPVVPRAAASPEPRPIPVGVENPASRAREKQGASFARFEADAQMRITRADLQREYSAYAIRDTAMVEDLIALTGEDVDVATLDAWQRVGEKGNLAALATLLKLHPERKSQIAWARAVERLEEGVISHDPRPDQDTWYHLFSSDFIGGSVEKGLLSPDRVEDGDLLVDFFRGFGPYDLPENLRAFLLWDDARAKGEDLPDLDPEVRANLEDLFGTDILKKTRVDFRREISGRLETLVERIFAGEELKPSGTNLLETEWYEAISERLKDIFVNSPDYRKSARELRSILTVSEREPMALLEEFNKLKTDLVGADGNGGAIGEEYRRLQRRLQPGFDPMADHAVIRRTLQRLERARDQIVAVTISDDPESWEAAVPAMAAVEFDDPLWEEMMAALFARLHKAERIASTEQKLAMTFPDAPEDVRQQMAENALVVLATIDFGRNGQIPISAGGRIPVGECLPELLGIPYFHQEIQRVGQGGGDQAVLYQKLARAFGFRADGKHPLVLMGRHIADARQGFSIDYPDLNPSEEIRLALASPARESALLDEQKELMRHVWGLEVPQTEKAEHLLLLGMMRAEIQQAQRARTAGNGQMAFEILQKVEKRRTDILELIQETKTAVAQAKASRAARAVPPAGATPRPAAAPARGGASPASAAAAPVVSADDARAALDRLRALRAGKGAAGGAPAASPDTGAPAATPDAAAASGTPGGTASPDTAPGAVDPTGALDRLRALRAGKGAAGGAESAPKEPLAGGVEVKDLPVGISYDVAREAIDLFTDDTEIPPTGIQNHFRDPRRTVEIDLNLTAIKQFLELLQDRGVLETSPKSKKGKPYYRRVAAPEGSAPTAAPTAASPEAAPAADTQDGGNPDTNVRGKIDAGKAAAAMRRRKEKKEE